MITRDPSFDNGTALYHLKNHSSDYIEYKPVATSSKAIIEGLITGLFIVGCFFGSAAVSVIADWAGRKMSILYGALLFALGGVVQAAANNAPFLYAGRLISGLAIGALSVVVPMFLSETAPTHLRGSLTGVYQLMITFGILIATAVNSIIWKATSIIVPMLVNVCADPDIDANCESPKTLALVDVDITPSFSWRLALGMQIIPSLLLVGILFFVPRSPRWLAEKNRHEEGQAVLAKLRSMDLNSYDVVGEYGSIRAAIEYEKSVGDASWGELIVPGIRNRLLLAVSGQALQQFSGINVIMYFYFQIFESMQIRLPLTITAVVLPLANALVNFIC